MNKEEAKGILWKSHFNIDDPKKAINSAVDKIYDDFEKEITHRDKTIELLNEEMLKLRKEVEDLKRWQPTKLGIKKEGTD